MLTKELKKRSPGTACLLTMKVRVPAAAPVIPANTSRDPQRLEVSSKTFQMIIEHLMVGCTLTGLIAQDLPEETVAHLLKQERPPS